MTRLSAAALLAAALTSGATAQEKTLPDAARVILEKAEDFELLALDPEPAKAGGEFHGWKVLGRTAVTDADTRKALVEAFEKGVGEAKGAAKCFNPRHGIRATHGGKTADFVVCFECYQVRVTVAGEKDQTVLVSRSPAAAFDAVLKKAGVGPP